MLFLLSHQITFRAYPSRGHNEESFCCVTGHELFRRSTIQNAELSTSQYFHFVVGSFMLKFDTNATLASEMAPASRQPPHNTTEAKQLSVPFL